MHKEIIALCCVAANRGEFKLIIKFLSCSETVANTIYCIFILTADGKPLHSHSIHFVSSRRYERFLAIYCSCFHLFVEIWLDLHRREYQLVPDYDAFGTLTAPRRRSNSSSSLTNNNDNPMIILTARSESSNTLLLLRKRIRGASNQQQQQHDSSTSASSGGGGGSDEWEVLADDYDGERNDDEHIVIGDEATPSGARKQTWAIVLEYMEHYLKHQLERRKKEDGAAEAIVSRLDYARVNERWFDDDERLREDIRSDRLVFA